MTGLTIILTLIALVWIRMKIHDLDDQLVLLIRQVDDPHADIKNRDLAVMIMVVGLLCMWCILALAVLIGGISLAVYFYP